MTSPFVLGIIPAIVLGIFNGLYWKKQGYSQRQYTILGMFIAYAFIVKAIGFFRD